MTRHGRRAVWGIVATVAVLGVALGLALVVRSLWTPSSAVRARKAYARGDWDRAAEILRAEIRDSSNRSADPELLRLYARCLVRLDRDSSALSIYDGRLGQTKFEPEDAFLKGLAIVRTGRLEAGLEIWQQALAEKPGSDHAEMLDNFTRLSVRLQRIDQALDGARRLSNLPGWEARGRFLLGEISELVDDPPGVVAALEEALRREPEARGALFDASHFRRLLARNLLRLGRAADAEAQLRRIPAVSSSSSSSTLDREAEWLLSRAYLQLDRMPEAGQALVRSGDYAAENRLMPEPSPFIGSAACAPCHRDESRAYEATRHNRTFYHGKDLLDLPRPDRPVADPDDPKVTHAIERKGEAIESSSRIGDQVRGMVVEYAFGTPQHYLTMIARDEQRNYRALRVSYYHTPSGSGWGATAGDVGHSDTVEDLRGQKIDVRDGVVRCLYCHVTRSRDFRDPPPEGSAGPEAADRAIGCERCHGPGGNHVQAVTSELRDRKGSTDFAIVNAAGTPGSTANGQCAECHTVGLPSQIKGDPENPAYVRSPGVTMTFSRCYTESNGAMSCMTCHDPHREASHSAAFYEAKCVACHSAPKEAAPFKGAASSAPAAPAGKRTVCPVNPARDCLNCHMPKIPMPKLHSRLTDHYIRVRKPEK
ncbi:MAG: tetratricopeptide repeat protein [Isosphaeraceae bacterium]